MSKWRPSDIDCIYVIPSVCGSIGALKLICNRILPLRKNQGYYDRLVMLGNYIGDGKSSYEVLDFLVEAKKKNKDRLILIKGAQEKNLIKAIELRENDHYDYWLSHGGKNLAMEYMKKANIGIDNPYLLERSRLKSIIPEAHIKLLHSMSDSYATREDKEIYRFSEKGEIDDNDAWAKEKWIINVFGYSELKKPYLGNNIISLDAGAPKRLIVLELTSMEALIAKPKKKKMVKFNIGEL